MRYLLFGTGDYYERYKKWFAKENISALLDNSAHKQGTRIDGIEVMAPEEGIKSEYDVIVILSFYVEEMRRQLGSLGVPDGKIYHFYDLHRLLSGRVRKKPVQYYGDFGTRTAESILLLSHDLELGGPALAMYQAAKVLVRNGYPVVFASMTDGPLKEILLEKGIPVVVDVNLQIGTMAETGWIKGFGLLICNTINYHVFLSERGDSRPVIWWLHDSGFFYHGVKSSVLRSIDRRNLTVCAVGPVPARAVHDFLPDLPIENLIYGVEDIVLDIDGKRAVFSQTGTKLCFATIGYIENRKGQDILVEAVRMLPGEIRDMTEFYLVGQNSSAMAGELIEQTEEIPEIVMTGAVDREHINEILNRADVLICPSREDPMPTVCAEAMMHSVPCIVSDVTGTADHIEDGVSGLVFSSEDVQGLFEKIMWCVNNRADLKRIGENARKVYENNFSDSVFEQRLLELVEKML